MINERRNWPVKWDDHLQIGELYSYRWVDSKKVHGSTAIYIIYIYIIYIYNIYIYIFDFEVITCNEDPFASYLLLFNQGSWPISISVMSQMHRLERRETYAGSDGLLFTMPWLQWDPCKFDTSSAVLFVGIFMLNCFF